MRKISFKNIFLLIISIIILIIGGSLLWVGSLKLPDFSSFSEMKIQSSTKIYDRTGNILLYNLNQDIKRTVIPYEDMGVNIKNATVAIEDSEFYQHKGIRIKSILRATVWAKITGKKVQGGSTITQQLIKNTLLTPERSLSRKIKEWILAIKLEKVMEKDDILALYLNEAPYGGNVYGVEEAAKTFFGKNPIDLTLAEASYLAAIPNAPTFYSPYGKNREKLEERKNLVLKRMFDLGFITKEEYDSSVLEKVVFLEQQPSHIAAPHFVFFIKDYLINKYGEEVVQNGGLKIITTLDYDLQKKAEEIVFNRAKENEKNWNGKNAAAVVIDPKTGQILSMVGSRDYFDKSVDGNFNVAVAERQPGSSFKPIVYALAFMKGYTEKTTLFDVKTEFNASCDPLGYPLSSSPQAKCYNPDNYDNGFRGPMTLRDALAQSINLIAVKLLYLVGVNDSINLAHDLGITTLNDPTRYGLSLVIGGGETTLLDMTSVYSVFANNGIRNPYKGVLSVEKPDGEYLEKFEDKSYKVLDQNITKILSSILSDNEARTPTFGANSSLVVPGYQVAVKTGTTNDNKDAWTIGYTPSITVGVWVGNNDNIPMKKGGAALAGPIWNSIISEALKKLPVESFDEPDPIDQSLPAIIRGYWQGGETFKIDTVSGGLATDLTPKETTKETSITNVHTILYWIDKNNPRQLKSVFGGGDSQYNNWEYGVRNWWELNKNKYTIITSGDIPQNTDNVHTDATKPVFEVSGLDSGSFILNNQTVSLSIKILNSNPIKKIDIFVDDVYLNSLKNTPYETSFTMDDLGINEKNNNLRIIVYDLSGNTSEKNIPFYLK